MKFKTSHKEQCSKWWMHTYRVKELYKCLIEPDGDNQEVPWCPARRAWTSPDCPMAQNSEEETRPPSSFQSSLSYWKRPSMPTPRAANPKLVFLEAPGQELPIGPLPGTVRPLEAELSWFEVLGSSPLTKMTKWKKLKVTCYPPKWLFLVFQMGPRNVTWATFCDETPIDPCSSG